MSVSFESKSEKPIESIYELILQAYKICDYETINKILNEISSIEETYYFLDNFLFTPFSCLDDRVKAYYIFKNWFKILETKYQIPLVTFLEAFLKFVFRSKDDGMLKNIHNVNPAWISSIFTYILKEYVENRNNLDFGIDWRSLKQKLPYLAELIPYLLYPITTLNPDAYSGNTRMLNLLKYYQVPFVEFMNQLLTLYEQVGESTVSELLRQLRKILGNKDFEEATKGGPGKFTSKSETSKAMSIKRVNKQQYRHSKSLRD